MSARSDKLQALVAEFAADDEKVLKGVNSAATRARKTLQALKKLCGDYRNDIQAERQKAKA